ncbi:hypothetical protein Tco_0891283 [Tanacetum coccineum]|uniref:Uncharacterized protein n=1 Tax=Tanacetum coccineum TaxID=301880 RepID=A0ABQ5C5V4_9ASTR
MVEENIPAPTRTDEQLVPVNARLPIGKRNLLMDLQKKQKNQIFRLSQFWKTLTMDTKSGINSFQLDELWFTLDADLIRGALGITPKDSAHPFVAPPASDLPILAMENYSIHDQPMLNRQDFWFTKLIICYLGGRHNIHKRPQSPLHIMADDYSLGNLKFVPKGELDEKYLDMAARKPRQATTVTNEEGGKKRKAPPAGKSKKPAPTKQPAPAKQTKPVKEKTFKPSPSKKIRKGKVIKVRKGKRYDHLVNEEDEEPQPASEPQVEDDEYNLQRGIQMSLESFQAPVGGVAIREPDSGIIRKLPEIKGKGKGIATDEQAAQSFLDLQKPKTKEPRDDTSMNVVCDTPSPADADTGADTEKSNSEADTKILNVGEEQGEDDFNTVALEERIVKLDEGQAGSDLGKTPESRPPPERVLMEEDQAGSNPGQSHVVQAGPNPEPMYEDFVATVYPQVHESLKLTTEEHVHIENTPSSSGTLSHQ